MSLAKFFEDAAPTLLGHFQPLPGVPEERWRMYGRFAGLLRESVLKGVYPETRRRMEGEAWQRVWRAYFEAHPCSSWELNANAEAFPAFLAALPDVAPWLAQLADLEWWRWTVFSALDEAPEAGLGLNPAAMLRPYQFDVVGMVVRDEPVSAEVACVAAIWRDAGGADRVAALSPAQLCALKAVLEKVPLEDAAAAAGLVVQELAEARDAMREEGLLVVG